MTVTTEILTFVTEDEVTLVGTLHGTAAAEAVVLINSATGVPARYYQRFATYLAERGLAVLTYDYRGIGRSRPDSLRGFDATMRDWGERDYPAALRALRRRVPNVPVAVVGHSFGGQALVLADDSRHLDAILLVGSQLGYVGRWPVSQRLWFDTAVRAVIPSVSGVLGYMPGKLGTGEDLPAGVARQWARWCRHPSYLASEVPEAPQRLVDLSIPVRAYAFSDDNYAPPAAVDALLQWLPAGNRERILLDPHDVGARSVGHFGFFRPQHKAVLWPEAAEWIREQLGLPAMRQVA